MVGYVGYRYISSYAATSVTVSGKITDQNGAAVAGVKLQTCTTAQPTTNSSGAYSFTVAKNGGFCVRILGYPANYSAARASSNHSNHITSATYEWQVAGIDCYSNKKCGAGKIGGDNGVLSWDRTNDFGNDFTVTYLATPPPTQASKLMWGIGDEVGPAQDTAIYKNASVNMLTAWYNTPGDLSWMAGYSSPSNTQVSDIYGKGKALELVVWLADGVDPRTPAQSATSGKTLPEYALSQQFLTDLNTLVGMYKGHGPNYGPLYVVLFTEFNSTYIYNWAGSPYTTRAQYNAALMTQYQKAVTQIHTQYNQAKVSLGFGGYDWSTSAIDLSSYKQAISVSDFTAVQAMQSCLNEAKLEPQIKASVQQLGSYGKPVMISHFKLWNDGAATNTPAQKAACATSAFSKFQQGMFNDTTIAQLKSWGLFAWDFMDDNYINDPGPTFDSAKTFINAHTASTIGFPAK